MTKKFDFENSEKELASFWSKAKIYEFDQSSSKQVFSIDTPPPYASADHLHVGHGMHYSQFEFVARYKRMRGFNVFFPMGFDDNGLPTERFVEKKHKINKSKTTRQEFIKLCLEETEKTGQTYKDLFNALGFSIDWNLLYHTIGKTATVASQKSFLDLYKKGLLYKKDAPIMWDTVLQTTLAQADLEDVEMKSHFNNIVFKVGAKEVLIGTTRPELIGACVALFYHPDDDRYKELKGKFAKIPLYDAEVPILPDEHVDPEKGTGLVMCCTFGDKQDIEWWQKHNLPLKIIINKFGKLNELAGPYEGLKVRDARKQIIQDLKEKKLLVSQKEIVHAVNISERSGIEIEFLKSPQWYIKVLDKKQELIDIAGKIDWKPKHMKVRYDHWVQNLQWDWCISRQRYFGVPFPVWYSKKTGEIILAEPSELPVDPIKDFPKNLPEGHTKEDIIPEKDVMDTWMTSSVTPQINARWGSEDEREGFLPMSMHPQAHDIIRTWAFYSIVKSYYHNKNIPWKTIMISGHGQDSNGKKMSKSKGNFVVAQEVIKKYGADAFRYWASTVKLGDDLPYQEKDVVTGKKTVKKIDNAANFVSLNLEGFKNEPLTKQELSTIDKWLLSKLQRTIKSCTQNFENYEYSKSKQEVDNFFWNTFCDYYLEFVKHRVYGENLEKKSKEAAQKTLYKALLAQLKLFAPIMPFITDYVYQRQFKEFEKNPSIHVSDWPEYEASFIDEKSELTGDKLVQIVDFIRKYKSQKQLSLKEELKKVIIKADEKILPSLEEIALDIKQICKINNLEFVQGDEFEVIIN